MRYVAITTAGGRENLSIQQGEIPAPRADEVLIRVFAAGVNRPDILQRQGLYPAPAEASPILGLEVAGEVVALGDHVNTWQLGDRVCALVNGGGYAEYAVAPAAQCLPVPKGFSMVDAAGLPETCFTVWHNLWQRARLQPGESVLIHGGASGIGTMAIQMAVALGNRVFATAGSEEKCVAIAELGAVPIHYREQDFVAEIKQYTEQQGVNVILDMVGGSYIQRNFAAAAKEGRIVNIAFQQGSVAQVDFMPLMLKRLTLTGSTLRAQSPAAKARIAQELRDNIWPLCSAQRIKPVIDSLFALDEVGFAHARMESNQHIGKVLLALAAE